MNTMTSNTSSKSLFYSFIYYLLIGLICGFVASLVGKPNYLWAAAIAGVYLAIGRFKFGFEIDGMRSSYKAVWVSLNWPFLESDGNDIRIKL